MSTTVAPPISNVRLWSGRVLSLLASAMLLFAAIKMLTKSKDLVDNLTSFGYPESSVTTIGAALLVSVICYLIPHTAAVGAALITGYLGGAVATHIHHGDPMMNALAPVIFAIIAWTGLVLRDPRLSVLLPWKR